MPLPAIAAVAARGAAVVGRGIARGARAVRAARRRPPRRPPERRAPAEAEEREEVTGLEAATKKN